LKNVALLVLANKQDLPDASSAEELAKIMDLQAY
jgi:signal recognition particle receptor subunit beta